MEEEVWLTCPNCGLEVFFLRTEAHGMVFVRVAEDGTVVPKYLDPAALPDAGRELLYCVNCGWNGKVSELVSQG